MGIDFDGTTNSEDETWTCDTCDEVFDLDHYNDIKAHIWAHEEKEDAVGEKTHMTPQEHYNRADEILAELKEAGEAVAKKIEEEGAWALDPRAIEQWNTSMQWQVKIAAIHATLATASPGKLS